MKIPWLTAKDVDGKQWGKAQKAAACDRAANSFEVIAREWIAKTTPSWSESNAIRIKDSWEISDADSYAMAKIKFSKDLRRFPGES